MSRRRVISQKPVKPDGRYKSEQASRFINKLMTRGKKSVSEGIFYGAMDILDAKVASEDPMDIFTKALNNVKPLLEVKSRRVGGSTYQVPIEVPTSRRVSVAMRWIIDFSRSRGEKTMQDRLAAELLDAYNNTGNSIKKKSDTHRMAEANKAFAHYRW